MTPMERFEEAYYDGLVKAVKAHPGEYPWAREGINDEMLMALVRRVADKLIHTVKTRGIGGIAISYSYGFIYAAKTLGIKNTYKDWTNFLAG